jgi:hypothetical protein
LFLASSRYDFRQRYSRSVGHRRISIFGRKASSSSEPRQQSHGQSSLYLQPPDKVGDQDDVQASRKPKHDQRWENKFSILEQFRNREGHCHVPCLHKENGDLLGSWVANQRKSKKEGKLSQDRAKRMEDLGFSWNRLESKWEDHFSLLELFQHREGHCDVPQYHMEKRVRLGFWVHKQRALKKRGELDPGKEQRLQELGFTWEVPPSNWENNLSLLKRFKKREGHCNVPRSHKEDGAPLGKWVATQRQPGKPLDQDKIQSLEEVGLLWDGLTSYQQRNDVQWEERLSLLQKFRIREGHCNAPTGHKEEGVNLGAWVVTQRLLISDGRQHPHRQKRLDEIGFVSQFSYRRRAWEEIFLLLETYKTREGHCNVPGKHKEEGVNLGSWVSSQRLSQKRGVLDPERELSLEEIGFVWRLYSKLE